jgi:pyruvate,water dikinase
VPEAPSARGTTAAASRRMQFIRKLRDVGLGDVALVGGKNASLGELLSKLEALDVRVPDGFAVTADAYRQFISDANLELPIREALRDVRKDEVADLVRRSDRVRELMLTAPMPRELCEEIESAYRELSRAYGEDETDVAVRSSATAEDLPTASFAGQQESFLNVRGAAFVIDAVRKAFASLFTPRAISYRLDMGFDHLRVALSVGVQKMVRSDLASAGVVFTLDPDTGHRGVVLVTSSFGLGESVVQGRVVPDQFYVHKETRKKGFRPLIWKKLGTKEVRLVYDEIGHRQVRSVRVPEEERARFSLDDDDVLTLARWSAAIEDHYTRAHGVPTPMDIEWAKDGRTSDLYVVQARPETVHSQRKAPHVRLYEIKGKREPIVTGLAIGDAVSVGEARVIRDPRELASFAKGQILVTETTDPDWEPIMKSASAVVTERGGRTSHAAIVARELGIPAVVGTGSAMSAIADGARITVSCAEGETGHVYRGELAFTMQEVDPTAIERPRTQLMLNVGNPDQAMKLSLLPSDGVGLARMEFIFASWVGVHPLALTRYPSLPATLQREVDRATRGYADKTAYFVDKLAQGVATIAAAFHPRPVILRFSDFKTNEYARLIGGAPFEPTEENPMLGWRGASRYYHPDYKEGFLLEVAAVKRVREEMGLTNLKLMIPFCRTPEEGEKVLAVMREGGLARGENGLEVLVMAEIPSNILLAERFARVFDGFSIGSNDLTQLTLGVDRDSTTVAPLFNERNEAVKWSCARLLEAAHAAKRKVGICGQAPSDFPDFAAFLVERGIDSISLSADALVRTMLAVVKVERAIAARGKGTIQELRV